MSSELDFDELHQQVSKLMDQAGKPKKKAHAKPAEKAVDEPPKEAPAVVAPKDEATPIAVAVRRPLPQIVPKRKGVAMDIVQRARPSAITPPSARASRTAATLHPTAPVTPEPPRPREAIIAPPESPTQQDVSEETLSSLNLQSDPQPRLADVATHDVKSSTFPDPLEVHGFTDDEDKDTQPDLSNTPPTMEHAAAIVAPPADASTEPQEEAESKNPPANSGTDVVTPFLNAKVEKRPLGAFAAAKPPEPAVNAPIPPAEPGNSAPKDEKLAEPEGIAPPPKELSPELVAVESSEPEFTPGTPGAPQQPAKTTVNDLRQMSIPPQYKAAEAAPAKGDRPIFDTTTYHPPIQPVAKVHKGGSRAGMLLTLILLILLVVAGVAAYYVATGDIDIQKLF